GARVSLPHAPDVAAVAGEDIGRAVRRAVIDDDDLDRRMGLRQHAIQRLGEIPLAVEHRNHARDEPRVARLAHWASPGNGGSIANISAMSLNLDSSGFL